MTRTEREYIWVGAHASMAAGGVFCAFILAAAGDPSGVVGGLVVAFLNGWASWYTLRRVRRLVRGGD